MRVEGNREGTSGPSLPIHLDRPTGLRAGAGPGSRDAITVLTDYGESRAYGLDSPVYPLGGIVPMHYWAPADRDGFLELLEGRVSADGRPYRVGREFRTTLSLFSKEEARGFTEAVGLHPGPPA